jgi:hypothetical protein
MTYMYGDVPLSVGKPDVFDAKQAGWRMSPLAAL